MNIELNPASALPVSEAAKTTGAENTSGSDFLDALIKVAQKNIPVEEASPALQPAMIEIKISALFDRATDFFNFADALTTGPQLNFMDVLFPDSPGFDFSMSLPVSKTAGNPQAIAFPNIFGI